MTSKSSNALRYVFGEETIDILLMGGIEPGSLILVLGHPGAGKSTFAAKMIYENIMRFSVKGLYVSFAETKEKFYSYMKRFNMDFELAEKNKLFEYIQMPTVSGKDLLEVTTSILSQKMLGEGYSIAVVDSVTPILNVLTTDEARAYLHTVLYNLTFTTKAILILIADLPFAAEVVDLKGLEFISDAVLVFKTRIEKGLIHRFIEIRKFRGRPIPMAEIPFAIEDGRGVRTLTAPTLLQPPYVATLTSYKDECVNNVWSTLFTGTYIGVVSECGVIPLSLWTLIVRLIHSYGLYYGVISFKEVPEIIKNTLIDVSKSLKIAPHHVIQKALFIESLNLSAYSTQQMEAILRNYIEKNINILILDDVESLYLYHDPIHVDRMLNTLSTYIKSGLTILFEFIDGIYTQSQTMRYDIIHRVSCIDNTIVHNVVHSRTIGMDIRSSRAITRLDDNSVVECIEKHPLG